MEARADDRLFSSRLRRTWRRRGGGFARAAIAIDRRADRWQHHSLSADPASKHRGEAGGLSGAPLKALALQRLRDFRRATGGALPLIAAGGIENGVDAFERVRAGASLVQLYTALVYRGPGLARKIGRELTRLLAHHGFERLTDAVGTEKPL